MSLVAGDVGSHPGLSVAFLSYRIFQRNDGSQPACCHVPRGGLLTLFMYLPARCQALISHSPSRGANASAHLTVLFLTVCLQAGILILSAISCKHGECLLCCLGRLSVLFKFTQELTGELRCDPLTSDSR